MTSNVVWSTADLAACARLQQAQGGAGLYSRDASWTAERIEELRRLWQTGQSTQAIGDAMGLTKNSVISKAHRLGLPGRPSPIRRGGAAVVRAAPAAPRRKDVPDVAVFVVAAPPAALPAASPPPVVTQPAAAALIESPTNFKPRDLTGRRCCFPIGEPRQPGFRFCDAAFDGSGNYCPEHRAICFERPKIRARVDGRVAAIATGCR